MTATEANLRDVHLHHLLPVIGASSRMETPPARTFVGMKDVFDRLDRFLRQMIELQEHRSIAALKFLVELPHHLTAPVVTFNKALALAICREAAKRSSHISASGTVVVLDQRVDLKTLKVGKRGAGVIGHRVTVTCVGRVLVSAHQIARCGQPQPACGTATQDHGLRTNDIKVGGTAVETHYAADSSGCIGQKPGCDNPVGDGDTGALELAIKYFLDAALPAWAAHR